MMKIKIDNLVVERNGFKLGEIKEELEPGYVYALVGNNGAGKTTFIQSILGGLEISGGNVFYGELGFRKNYEEIKSLYAYVPDDCYFTSRVYRIVDAIATLDSRFSKNRCNELLELFQIDITKKMKELSKGSVKKFLFSLGLSFDSKVLVLDEPTANVDPKSKEMMLEILRDYMADDKIIIFSTHIISEVSSIADYVMLLNNGKLILKEDIVTLQENNKDANNKIQPIEKIVLSMLD